MRARADMLLRYTPAAPAGRLRGLLRTVLATPEAPGTLHVTLPEAYDKSWQRDGVAERPPAGLGQRSWWLSQILALVPSSHWEQLFGVGPAHLIAAAIADDAGLAVLEGWSRAAIRHKATNWICHSGIPGTKRRRKTRTTRRYAVRCLERWSAALPSVTLRILR